MKMLIVDDHPLILQALEQVLRDLDANTEVVEARDAQQALDALALHPDLDLVLLDLTLPGRSGLDLLPELRRGSPGIPVVVLSATEDRETVMCAIREGAMGFIPKSAKTDVLVAALRLVFSGGVYLPASAFTEPVSARALPSPGGAMTRHPRDVGLTDRQAQVLALLVQGKSNKLICRQLDLAEGTVKIHVTAILRALNVSNRTEAVVAVSRLGLKLETLSSAKAAVC